MEPRGPDEHYIVAAPNGWIRTVHHFLIAGASVSRVASARIVCEPALSSVHLSRINYTIERGAGSTRRTSLSSIGGRRLLARLVGDGDGDVDLADLLLLVDCVGEAATPECKGFDFDNDDDVDLSDLVESQTAFTGSR